ncbi:flagellar hook-length control protein FliK [Paraburkholderia ferrariae]|uniref:flagellar hook-length control protein FliK n=1 Tax=Paraburkholderia ferrariae TaxID=386056 RepID=UPI000489D4AF|nr:flagellar hook-length control protein FliK [Paraburkholderia ferrariae]
MNGIDTGASALSAGRVSALNPVGSQGSAGAAQTGQTGVSALAGGAAALPDAQSPNPQASTQTVLSAVALALDAIIRSGGEATPAVVGQAPVWSDPDAADSAGQGSLPLPGMPAGAAQLASELETIESTLLADDAAALAQSEGGAANLAANPNGTAAAGANAAAAANAATADGAAAGAQAPSSPAAQATQAATAAQSGAVAALAAALEQTVTGSGLFYESHLAQWLLGQRTPAELADEPQNRLMNASAQLPLDWTEALDEADDVLWAETPAPGGRGTPAGGARADSANASPQGYAGQESGAATLASNAALVRANGLLSETMLLPAAQDQAAAGQVVHAAVIPLVRQQLDLLATGEFRWTGEAWPGVRLDWSIQQDRYDPRDGHHGAADADEPPWRTRLTLALPSLGTVDAELTLSGEALAVRVQASSDGAARLTEGSEALRSRLEALGLALTSLAIREIGAAPGPAEASKAAHAYARAAAAAAAQDAQEAQAHAHAQAGATGDFDWELR